jgi:glycosyltransferase involved in cell wall biosynthesis
MLAQFYPPDIGGEERHVRNLARALSARGHDVDVLTTALPETGAGSFVEDGIRIRRARTTAQRLPLHGDADRPHATPFADIEMRRAIDSSLSSTNYDVVHAHNWIVNSAIGPTGRRHVPLVLTLHDYSHVCAVKRYVHQGRQCDGPGAWKCTTCAADYYGGLVGPATAAANVVAARRRRAHVTYFVAVSSAVAAYNELDRGDAPYEVIPNFVPDDLIEDCPPRPDGPLLFVGDVTSEKGILVLAEAYQRLSAPPELVIAGRQPPGTQLVLAPGMRVTGPLRHEEVMSLVASARLMVVPSIMPDPCPTVVLEAMAKGRPVVASANGGIVDMVEDGITGHLVAPGDPNALARGISAVLASDADAAAMGAAGRKRVLRFTASAVVERIEGVYRRAMVLSAHAALAWPSSLTHSDTSPA